MALAQQRFCFGSGTRVHLAWPGARDHGLTGGHKKRGKGLKMYKPPAASDLKNRVNSGEGCDGNQMPKTISKPVGPVTETMEYPGKPNSTTANLQRESRLLGALSPCLLVSIFSPVLQRVRLDALSATILFAACASWYVACTPLVRLQIVPDPVCSSKPENLQSRSLKL